MDRQPEVVSVSVTEAGRRLAERLPYRAVHRGAADALRSLWDQVDGLVVFLATGATVRVLAPLLAVGGRAPAVVCVDEAGRFAVALVGGHRGGANALAIEVAACIGATPVVTTATDAAGLAALDELPGFTVHGDVAGLSRALLDGAHVVLDNRVGWPLPPAVLAASGARRAIPPTGTGATTPTGAGSGTPTGSGTGTPIGTAAGMAPGSRTSTSTGARARTPIAPGAGTSPGSGTGTSMLVVDDRACAGCSPSRSAAFAPGPGQVVAHPPSLVVGVGCATGATARDVADAISEAADEAGVAPGSLSELATIDRRRDHEAVIATHLPVRVFTAEQLAAVVVPHPSEAVRQAVGTPSVAEAAALLAAGEGGSLVTAKHSTATATAAIARRSRPPARLTLVGLGPGGAAHRSPAATAAVRHADVVIGYHAYVDQCAELLRPHQEVVRSPIGAELDRARQALDLAAGGRSVAMVCSGDPGVFAMASPVLEMAADPAYRHVEVIGVPGVTAAHAAAAVLGAPLGHDHAVVSLSDLLTPWSVIEQRIEAVAEADLAVAFYNPRSARRDWQLEQARKILLRWRPPTTPVGIVTDAGRPDQHVMLATLKDLEVTSVSMTSCVVVGSSTTVMTAGRMVTPRGYPSGGSLCAGTAGGGRR